MENMSDKRWKLLSSAEKLQWYKEKKKQDLRNRVKKSRQKKRREIKTQKVYHPKYQQKLSADQQRKLKLEKDRQMCRERVRRHRERVSKLSDKPLTETPQSTPVFQNRMQKSRSLKQIQDCLTPYTPVRRSKIISSLLNKNSPYSVSTRRRLEMDNVIKPSSETSKCRVADAIFHDTCEALKVLHDKDKDRTVKQNTKNAVQLIVGNAVLTNKLQSTLASHTGLNRRLIHKHIKKTQMSETDQEDCRFTGSKRKIRSDRISENVKEKVTAYWIENSQPLNGSRQMIRQRIERKKYVEHPKHILTTTQTNIYKSFIKQNPDVIIGQRSFEKLKPFYIKPAQQRDRLSCLCKAHQEMKILFNSAKQLRRDIFQSLTHLSEDFIQWESLSDLVNETLCPPVAVNGDSLHKIECLERTCFNCGVDRVKLMAMELDDSDVRSVSWQKYEYVSIGKKDKNGKVIKKLKLVNVLSSPFEMWKYIKQTISNFPLHEFQATWQRKQLFNITSNLPDGHVVMIHDYSEDFRVELQDEIQCEYFARNEIAMHVTVLFRHHDADGTQNLVKEYVFVIFDENTHDRDTIHHVRKLIINKYLKDDLKYNLTYVHEFTDGCSQQYKSKFCMKDISFSAKDFGCGSQRNYFETSHGKGEQDAAGSHVKNKARMSIIRRECKIDSAADLYKFLKENFEYPASSSFVSRQNRVQLKRRLFFYVSSNDVERNRRTAIPKQVVGNRKIHSIRSVPNKSRQIFVRRQSCYCNMCINENFAQCLYTSVIGAWELRKL